MAPSSAELVNVSVASATDSGGVNTLTRALPNHGVMSLLSRQLKGQAQLIVRSPGSQVTAVGVSLPARSLQWVSSPLRSDVHTPGPGQLSVTGGPAHLPALPTLCLLTASDSY